MVLQQASLTDYESVLSFYAENTGWTVTFFSLDPYPTAQAVISAFAIPSTFLSKDNNHISGHFKMCPNVADCWKLWSKRGQESIASTDACSVKIQEKALNLIVIQSS